MTGGDDTATVRNYLRVQLPPEEAIKLFRFIQDEKAGLGSFDFNKVEPMPPWVFRGELCPEAERKYGPENCWLQWSKSHWGCARNTINPSENAAEYDYRNTIVFDTENRDVRTLIRKLSLIFKNPQLDYIWADEDIGQSCGMIGFRDGTENYSVLPEPFSRRAYELSFDVFGSRPEEYGMVYDPKCNNYVYAGKGVQSASLKVNGFNGGETICQPTDLALRTGWDDSETVSEENQSSQASRRIEPTDLPPSSTIRIG